MKNLGIGLVLALLTLNSFAQGSTATMESSHESIFTKKQKIDQEGINSTAQTGT